MEKIRFKVFGIPFRVSKWSKNYEYAMLGISVLTIISAICTLAFDMTIPGLTPISLAIVMLLMGVKYLNVYYENLKKENLFMGLAFVIIFGLNLAAGIMQLTI